jgi:hypothetical protein
VTCVIDYIRSSRVRVLLQSDVHITMKNERVILKSFLGTTKRRRGTSDRENYWKLIGEKGNIIDDRVTNGRVLFLFESNLDDYRLENHNPIKNSLWIKMSDLKSEIGGE